MTVYIPHAKTHIKTAVFDFDGTLSTLRRGWETVMAPMMEEYISGGAPDAEIKALVADYIDRSTGVQTIMQMKWLAEKVRELYNPGAPADPWFYKDEYNRRLMAEVARRRDAVLSGDSPRADWLVAGAEEFLAMLCARGVSLYAASGTDECDVRAEAETLGLTRYFKHDEVVHIAGAQNLSEGCSKEATLRRLIACGGEPSELIVIGDGPVEIALGREFGALTLGVASDEENRRGINPAKLRRLTAAGAHAVVADFIEPEKILDWAGIL